MRDYIVRYIVDGRKNTTTIYANSKGEAGELFHREHPSLVIVSVSLAPYEKEIASDVDLDRPVRRMDRPKLLDFETALHQVLRSLPGAYAAIEALRVAKLKDWENETTDMIASTLDIPTSVARVAVKHSRLNANALARARQLNDMLLEVERLENEVDPNETW